MCKRNIDRLSLSWPQLGTWWPFGLWDYAQPTEPHQPALSGHKFTFVCWDFDLNDQNANFYGYLYEYITLLTSFRGFKLKLFQSYMFLTLFTLLPQREVFNLLFGDPIAWDFLPLVGFFFHSISYLSAQCSRSSEEQLLWIWWRLFSVNLVTMEGLLFSWVYVN